jgi:hypothetical protein
MCKNGTIRGVLRYGSLHGSLAPEKGFLKDIPFSGAKFLQDMG